MNIETINGILITTTVNQKLVIMFINNEDFYKQNKI